MVYEVPTLKVGPMENEHSVCNVYDRICGCRPVPQEKFVALDRPACEYPQRPRNLMDLKLSQSHLNIRSVR